MFPPLAPLLFLPQILLALSSSSPSSAPPPLTSSNSGLGGTARVTSLSRFAVKGLGPTPLTFVSVSTPGETFPDDRRFALLKKVHEEKFDEERPEWIHKEKFLCAFSDPDLMAGFDCDYSAEPDDEENADEREVRRMLTVYRRDRETGRRVDGSGSAALGPVDLSTADGRSSLASFSSDESGEHVVCVAASSAGTSSSKHTHQFGNTRSGVRERGDTRTIHLINAATVRELSDRIGVELNPGRFRPNVVVDGLEPWEEFRWVGRSARCVRRSGDSEDGDGLTIDVICRTVRCEGIGIDPTDPATGKLNMPKLLQEHYPEHGPYFGVYAVISGAGRMGLGDELTLLPLEEKEQ